MNTNQDSTPVAAPAGSGEGESELVRHMRRLRARSSNCPEANALIDQAIAVQIAAEKRAGTKAHQPNPAWVSIRDSQPPTDVEVMTKIHDDKGVRNVQSLRLHRGLWWTPDMAMYVYYCPTHWAPKQNTERSGREERR